ncbi:hypothetical protein PFICI_11150 [Pestalotiopsis fici W106-1]|uniref:Uncharacterized protein n=1 Tax=Pestalotiopsis fici (strain W106-1 / CGMCC3.15140) TaxID=1229662 RepID=W3WWN4_PESFW|nr:uncharacterized protein PFICI_11150 [Pestalotiopsis fici W106-1]ETS77276.1 hypothetical protein PFICI_11150 [Pestalotiopsis fici W106-1]
MQINIDQGSDKWIMLQFPSHDSQKHFGFPGIPRLVIGWRVPLPAEAGETMQPELFLSTLLDVWIPEDDIDLFQQFLQTLRGRWYELCNLVDERFVQCRSDQLQAEGRSPEMMRRLAKDAQRLANLRLAFRGHLKTSRDYILAKGANSRHSDSARELLLDLQDKIGGRLTDLESTIKELLQIEFSWAAITESRISTNLGQNVMLLTYVSIFYLPLAFCAALWAIPNLSERATLNSFIITSVVVGVATLLIAFHLENIASLFRGKYSQWREKVVEDMHKDVRWETRADELQNSLQTRSSPSEWLLVIFLLSQLIRKLKGERNTQKGQPQSV